jgi:hypothetical protein
MKTFYTKSTNLFMVLAMILGIAFTGCNDSFLDKTPVTELTEETAFNSYDNFKAFMWPCYEMFTNTTIRTSIASGSAWGANGHYLGDVDAGYLQKNNVAGYNEFANQVKGSTASGNGWDFSSFIRRINIMWSFGFFTDDTGRKRSLASCRKLFPFILVYGTY